MESNDIIKSVIRHIALIAIITFLTTAITAYISWNVLPKTYTAETTLYVMYRSSEDTLNSSEMSISSQLVNDYSELIRSNRVIDGAASQLGLSSSEVQNSYQINVNTSTTTRLLKLEVTGTNPTRAANIANALATELAKCILDVTNITNISVVDQAKVPTEPSGPQSLKITGEAGIFALMASIALAVIIDMINVKIITKEDVQSILGVSVLAQIPLDFSK